SGCVVLVLVDSFPLNFGAVAAPSRPQAESAEAVFHSSAEVAGELAPGAVRAELVHADRARAAEHVGHERPGARLRRIAQHEVAVIGELVELAAAADGRAANAVLGEAPRGAQPHPP